MGISDFRIVADSASDVFHLKGVDYASVPLKIITNENEFVDNKALDVEHMIKYLSEYKGRSSTACPAPMEWYEAFGDSKYVFCVTLTSKLSGSYNAACLAKTDYEENYPDRKVFVIDSLSAGPEERLIIEKLQELITAEKTFEEISEEITNYTKRTSLYFVLESLTNFANNGRVDPSVAKIASMLGIRIVGKANEGELKPLVKCCGEKKALSAIIERIENTGYKGGKVRIAYCMNEDAARKIAVELRKKYENSDIKIYHTAGLCSFYAEKGGLLVGFEKSEA